VNEEQDLDDTSHVVDDVDDVEKAAA